MIRNPLIATLAGLTVATFLVAESQPSDAQLFQRLRDRIQSRRLAPPLPTNRQRQPGAQPPQQSEAQPALRPTSQPAPAPAVQSTVSRYNSPRQVSPVKPGLVEAEKIQSPEMLGMRYTNVQGQRGAVVTEIQKNSPASVSGLKIGDRIVAIDGRLLISAEAFRQIVADHHENFPVNVRMVRDGKLLSAKIDPHAKATLDDSLTANDGQSLKTGKNESALSGFGALLGGLLGGKPKPKPEPKDEMALGDDEELEEKK